MNAAAITQGTFADFKLVKSRSTAQLVIEIPIEAADAALTALGGVPLPGKECWVAIARLKVSVGKERPAATPAPAEQPQAKEHRKIDEVPLPQRAGMLVSDPSFKQWMQEVGHDEDMMPDQWLKLNCNIESKRELATNETAARVFLRIESDFRHWKTLPPLSAYEGMV